MILCDYDASGNMYNLASAVNRYTKHHASMVKLRVHPDMKFHSMLVATKDNMEQIRQAVYDADAVVFKEFWWIADKLGLNMSRLKGKPMAGLMGGGGFRFERERVPNFKFFIKHGVKIAATSVDFLYQLRMKWVPSCVRYEELRETFDYKKTEPPLIVASPSKDTDLRLNLRRNFLQMMDELNRGGFQFKSLFIGGAQKMITNDECLKLKARASIFFDRIYDIYGVNSQEAATFGGVVVTGTNDFALQKLREFGFECPFLIVKNHAQAKDAFRKLLSSSDFMTQKSEECREYVERLHSGRESAKRLVELLES